MHFNFFPLGLAQDKAFCNREHERKILLDNFAHNQHTLIASPRRYGKTSLALKAIDDGQYPFSHVDFFLATNAQRFEDFLLRGIGDLILQIVAKPQQALKIAKDFLTHLDISLSSEKLNVQLRIQSKQKSIEENILEALQGLDKLAQKQKKKVVLLLDEFQVLAHIENNEAITAAIRHVAQKTKHLIFIFSGSNRHLLSTMFDDSHSPLYMLCEKLTIARIKVPDYFKYIAHAHKLRWHQSIDKPCFNIIMSLTEQHAYYINALCAKLWREEKAPNVKSVEQAWENYISTEQTRAVDLMEKLSKNQKQLLIGIAAQQGVVEPTQRQFLREVDLSSASVLQALTVLKQKDYIYKDANGAYQVLDPLLKAFILQA